MGACIGVRGALRSASRLTGELNRKRQMRGIGGHFRFGLLLTANSFFKKMMGPLWLAVRSWRA